MCSTGQSARQQTLLALPQKLEVLPPLFASLQNSHLDADPTVRKPEALIRSQCLALLRVPWRPGLDTAGVKMLATAHIACKRAGRGNFGCVWGSESVLSDTSADENHEASGENRSQKECGLVQKPVCMGVPSEEDINPAMTIDEYACTYMGGMRPRTSV